MNFGTKGRRPGIIRMLFLLRQTVITIRCWSKCGRPDRRAIPALAASFREILKRKTNKNGSRYGCRQERIVSVMDQALQALYETVLHRKDARQEGSYTCYLFEKGWIKS